MSPADRKVALVTGGGRRIGAEICRALAGAGFAVALSFRTSRREAARLAREIGGRAIPLDLSRPASIDRAAATMGAACGRLDLLVHNAAVFPRTPAETLAPADWDAVFAVNLRGPFLLTRALLPRLREVSGGVCFLGDAGAGRLWPAYLPYCLSKIALERLATAWKRMLAPAVRVGIVRPGLALRPEGFPRQAWERLRARGDLRGPDSPGKIAAAVLRFARSGRYTFSCIPIPTRKERRMSQWKCIVCAYVYDPATGDPDNGVEPGTRFEDLPDDWVCPLCGAGKDEFEEIRK